MMTKRNAVKFRQAVHRTDESSSAPGRTDADLLAYSTLPPGDYDDLVEVYKIRPGMYTPDSETMHRTWLHDVLDDNNIPYIVEVVGVMLTRRKFGEIQVIYVQKKNAKKAKALIKEYNNAAAILPEDRDDVYMPGGTDGGLLQVKCPSCGREVDFDYAKCPHCKGMMA